MEDTQEQIKALADLHIQLNFATCKYELKNVQKVYNFPGREMAQTEQNTHVNHFLKWFSKKSDLLRLPEELKLVLALVKTLNVLNGEKLYIFIACFMILLPGYSMRKNIA